VRTDQGKSDRSRDRLTTHAAMTQQPSATIPPVRTHFCLSSTAACALRALRSTLLSSQEAAARSAYARSKPG